MCQYLTQFVSDFLGFTRALFNELKDHLPLPEEVKVHNKTFSGEEMIIVGMMKLISSPTTKVMSQKEILAVYRDFLNGCSKAFVDHLYEMFFHKITGSSMDMWTNKESVTQFR